jgi:hypothetical protein
LSERLICLRKPFQLALPVLCVIPGFICFVIHKFPRDF